MAIFDWSYWPLHFICLAMVVAAIIDGWIFKVPNKLTYPLIFSGWLFGLCHDLGWLRSFGIGGFLDSFVVTCVGFALLVWLYALGGMGAGDVKMQSGFAAWIGAFFGMRHGSWIMMWAFFWAALIGGVIAMCMIVLRGKYRENVDHTREILGDLVGAANVSEIAEKANNRRPRWHRLPYGIPLCIGFLAYLLFTPALQDYQAARQQGPAGEQVEAPGAAKEKGPQQ